MDAIWSSQSNEPDADSQNQPSSSSLSIAEVIAQTANEFISEQVLPGYTYCPQYSMYYNSQSGYFYDPNSCLFYHPSSQFYYRYNHQSNSYETIQTQAIAQPVKWIKKKSKKRALAMLQTEDLNFDQMQVDVLETIFEMVDKCAFLAGDFMAGGNERRMKKIEKRRAKAIERIFKLTKGAAYSRMEEYPDIPEIMSHSAASRSKSSVQKECKAMVDSSSESEEDSEAEAEELRRWQMEEESSKHAACIRLVETNSSSISAPLLHIVTISGATIGFGQTADIQLSGSAPSTTPLLFSITYMENKKEPCNSYYQAEFYATQIKFNDVIVKINLSSSNTQMLKHDDKISFGSYTLFLHLHNGLNTCPRCEPGLFPATQIQVEKNVVRSKPKSTDAQRRQNNRLMKEQYGLLDQDQDLAKSRTKYTDRAYKRRKEELKSVSQVVKTNAAGGIYANCLAAPQPGTSSDFRMKKIQDEKPVFNSSEKSNSKGFQLLKCMGWKEGQGLGKNQQGIQEPILSTLKSNRAGLGSECTVAKSAKISIQINKSKNQMEKEAILEKTRQRYQQINQNTQK